MLARVLSWLALLARFDATKDVENTEVEEQSVGGDRHDVRAYIGVRQ
jgi:hypothetical protein